MIISSKISNMLAQAVQKFRNSPALGNSDVLKTQEYGELCRAWEIYTDNYPNARLNYDETESVRNPRAGIHIFVRRTAFPFSKTAEKRLRKMIAESLERSGHSGRSASGQSLALAVDYCEERGLEYIIRAMPGVGYTLELVKDK